MKKSKDFRQVLKGAQDQMSFYEIYEKYEIDVQTCLQKYLTNSVLAEFSL
jgi:hypothetical protein